MLEYLDENLMHDHYHGLPGRPGGNTPAIWLLRAMAAIALMLINAGLSVAVPVESRSTELRIPSDWSYTSIRTNINKMADMGMNAVRVEVFYHGGTIYPSAVMTKWGLPASRPDFTTRPNALPTLISAAHARGMAVYAWVETFYVWNTSLGSYNPVLKKYPEWSVRNADGTDAPRHGGETAYRFISPANLEARQFIKELYAEIARTGVDGIFFDYLRYPVGSLGPQDAMSYDEASKARAQAELGLDITQIPLDLQNPDFQRWTGWRIKQTTDFAKELAGAVRTANPKAVFVASVHPWPGDDWRALDTLRDWPAWQPEVKVFSPQYYAGLDAAKAWMERDFSALSAESSLWPNILASDIQAGSPLLEYVRTQPHLGVSHWVYSALTSDHAAALKAGPYREAALEPTSKPHAGAAALVDGAIPSLPADAREEAGLLVADLTGTPPCLAPAQARLDTLLARTDLGDARRDLDVARRVLALAPTPIPGDADADGRVSLADAVRVLRAAPDPSNPCLGFIDLAPPGGDGEITVADAAAILARGLGVE